MQMNLSIQTLECNAIFEVGAIPGFSDSSGWESVRQPLLLFSCGVVNFRISDERTEVNFQRFKKVFGVIGAANNYNQDFQTGFGIVV